MYINIISKQFGSDTFTKRQEFLIANTGLAKYSLHAEKIVGISFVFKDNYFYIDWAYIEHQWTYSDETESFIKENDFFSTLEMKG